GKRFDTTGRALYGPVETNNFFKGFGGPCEARNNGDAVVRYDQLANRWLIVMPIFARGPARPDQPPVWEPAATAYLSPPGRADQPGLAVPLFQPAAPTAPLPPPPPVAPNAPGTPPRPDAAPPPAPYSMCYAISAGADPMGPYFRYQF